MEPELKGENKEKKDTQESVDTPKKKSQSGGGHGGSGDGSDNHTKRVLASHAPTIGTVFTKTMKQVQGVLTDDKQAVDLEITFTGVSVQKGGIPLIAPKTEQSTMQIKLATRIFKAPEGPPGEGEST